MILQYWYSWSFLSFSSLSKVSKWTSPYKFIITTGPLSVSVYPLLCHMLSLLSYPLHNSRFIFITLSNKWTKRKVKEVWKSQKPTRAIVCKSTILSCLRFFETPSKFIRYSPFIRILMRTFYSQSVREFNMLLKTFN